MMHERRGCGALDTAPESPAGAAAEVPLTYSARRSGRSRRSAIASISIAATNISGKAMTHSSFARSASFSMSRYQASASTAAMTAIEPNSRCLSAPKSIAVTPSGQSACSSAVDLAQEILVAGEDDDQDEIGRQHDVDHVEHADNEVVPGQRPAAPPRAGRNRRRNGRSSSNRQSTRPMRNGANNQREKRSPPERRAQPVASDPRQSADTACYRIDCAVIRAVRSMRAVTVEALAPLSAAGSRQRTNRPATPTAYAFAA